MQALILAAGRGVRLNELGLNCPKCMLEINGEKLIDRLINYILPYDPTSIVINVNFMADEIISHLQTTYPTVPFIFIDEREEPPFVRNNLYSFNLALPYLHEETWLFESDIIFDQSIIHMLAGTRGSAAILGRWEPFMQGTVVKYKNRDLKLQKAALSPETNANNSLLKTANIYKLSSFCLKKLKRTISKYVAKEGWNHYYEDAFNWADFTGIEVDNKLWYEIDTPADYYVAEIQFSRGEEKYELMASRYGGYWRFPNLVDGCYLRNPFYKPTRLLTSLRTQLDTIIGAYPSGEWEGRKNAARLYNIRPENLLLGNGATELIKVLSQHFSNSKYYLKLPTFNEYVELFGKQQYTTDFDEAEVIIIVNPNNPTNEFIKFEQLDMLINEHPDKTFVVDESFIDFADQEVRYTLINQTYLETHPNLIVLKSLGKSFNINGLKLGILASTEDNINLLKTYLTSWNINSFAQEFLAQVDMKEYQLSCIALAAERHRFIQKLKILNDIEIYPSQTNFLTIELKVGNAHDFCVKMFDKYNIFIKDLTNKVDKQLIRLSINDKEQNEFVTRCFRQELY